MANMSFVFSSSWYSEPTAAGLAPCLPPPAKAPARCPQRRTGVPSGGVLVRLLGSTARSESEWQMVVVRERRRHLGEERRSKTEFPSDLHSLLLFLEPLCREPAKASHNFRGTQGGHCLINDQNLKLGRKINALTHDYLSRKNKKTEVNSISGHTGRCRLIFTASNTKGPKPALIA